MTHHSYGSALLQVRWAPELCGRGPRGKDFDHAKHCPEEFRRVVIAIARRGEIALPGLERLRDFRRTVTKWLRGAEVDEGCASRFNNGGERSAVVVCQRNHFGEGLAVIEGTPTRSAFVRTALSFVTIVHVGPNKYWSVSRVASRAQAMRSGSA